MNIINPSYSSCFFQVKLGALDATVHQRKASEYNVRGYPSIKYFAGGKKDSSSAEDYSGGRTASDIVAFALEKHAENVPAPELVQVPTLNLLKSTILKHLLFSLFHFNVPV